MESARPARDDDRRELDRLWAAVLAEVTDQRGGAVLVSTLAPEAAPGVALGLPGHLVVAGCIDAAVVGFATARLDAHAVPPVAVVDAVYVEAGAREIGVGEAMTDTVVEWATAQGCRGVDASALPGNRQAKAFFEDNGFVARVLIMHRSLPLGAAGGAAAGTAPPAGT